MLRRLTTRIINPYNSPNPYRPPQSPPPNRQQKTPQRSAFGSLSSLTEQRKKQSLQYHKKFKQAQTNPTINLKSHQDHQICQIVLYMKHDQWKSQYIYSMMNYQQLGFLRVSDYGMLKDMSDFLGLSKKEEGQWPVLKFSVPLEDNQFVVGMKDIIEFIDQKQLFLHEVDDNPSLDSTIEKYIEQNIVPNLQAIFWHPRLTFEQAFHTNLASYQKKGQQNYRIISLILKNLCQVFLKIPKNLLKIYKNPQLYKNSRKNIQSSLKQLIKMLNNKEYIGGTKPNHLDFYLYAILSTKIGNKYFQEFLRNDIGGDVWAWVFRMKKITKYEKDRVTLL